MYKAIAWTITFEYHRKPQPNPVRIIAQTLISNIINNALRCIHFLITALRKFLSFEWITKWNNTGIQRDASLLNVIWIFLNNHTHLLTFYWITILLRGHSELNLMGMVLCLFHWKCNTNPNEYNRATSFCFTTNFVSVMNVLNPFLVNSIFESLSDE